jgi:hypothetical protein
VSRRASFAALVLAIVLVAGSVAALVGGVALGMWQPAGPSHPTTTAPPGAGSGGQEYGDFLDDVRAGRVLDVFQDGNELQVSTSDGGYTVGLPPGEPDVFSDMQAAAQAGGVPVPAFSSSSGPNTGPPKPMSYPELLEEVTAGRVYDVFHEGDRLMVSTFEGPREVDVPNGVDVLDDLERAAAEGDVAAPSYTKVPGEPG